MTEQVNKIIEWANMIFTMFPDREHKLNIEHYADDEVLAAINELTASGCTCEKVGNILVVKKN